MLLQEEQIYIAMKPVFLGGRVTEELEAPLLPERQARNLVLDRPPVPIPSTEDNQSNPRYAPFLHRNSTPVISTRTELFSEQPPKQEFSPIEENPTNPEIGIVEPKMPKPLNLHPKLTNVDRRKSAGKFCYNMITCNGGHAIIVRVTKIPFDRNLSGWSTVSSLFIQKLLSSQLLSRRIEELNRRRFILYLV